MADLNLDLHYFEHPKTVRLVGLLGRGAEVLPIKLWAYCGKVHAESGKLSNYSTRELESAIGWWGKESEAVAALVKVGFVRELTGVEAGFEAVDWLEHQGHLAAFKERSRKANEVRWASRTPSRSPKAEGKESSYLPTYQPVQQQTDGDGAARRGTAFVRPSLESVRAYCLERGNSVDAQAWLDHYTANGWKVGRNAMKDWKAAVRTWEKDSRGTPARPGKVGAPQGKYDGIGERHELV